MRRILGLLALTPLFVPAMALADARDDVVAGMMRCAVITDDRQWLDCYYGAAQPMRGHLGLSPAPQSQQRLMNGSAHVEAPVQPNIYRGEPALAPMTASVAPGPAIAPVRSGPPPMPKPSGVNLLGGGTVVRNAPMQSYQIGPDGAFRVTLPDGEVWQQTSEDAAHKPVRWHDPADTMRVTISRGAMGTFNLALVDGGITYKVTRVK